MNSAKGPFSSSVCVCVSSSRRIMRIPASKLLHAATPVCCADCACMSSIILMLAVRCCCTVYVTPSGGVAAACHLSTATLPSGNGFSYFAGCTNHLNPAMFVRLPDRPTTDGSAANESFKRPLDFPFATTDCFVEEPLPIVFFWPVCGINATM